MWQRLALKVTWLIIFFCFFYCPIFAQDFFTISGTVRSGHDGENLIGVAIAVRTLKSGTTSNAYGFYSLRLPSGTYTIQYSYVGYKTLEHKVNLSKNITVNIELPEASQELSEVLIQAGSIQEKLTTSQMSIDRITAREAKLLPALFGEVDILKTLQLKPGVQSGGEGTSGLYVRGGGSDQNLFLLDEATIYNASHLFGFFSIFNSDAVRSVDLYKGGFPAQFGGRLSSVVDIKLKEGNNKMFSAIGGIGLISSRLTVEGPIKKNKSSFIISGRRTYFDIFTRVINKLNANNKGFNPIPNYYFYDFNAKANFDLGPKDRLYISGYLGSDVFGFRNSGFAFDFNWGNKAATARWNHIFNSKLFLNNSVTLSSYNYTITNRIADFKFKLSSDIKDISIKSDFDYLPGNAHSFKFGVQATAHTFDEGRLKANSADNTIGFSAGNTYKALEYGFYASDDFKPSPRLTFNYGLRLSGFQNKKNLFNRLEPRFSGRYALTQSSSLKASYTNMMQYIHLVTNSGASLPTDIWYPSSQTVKPQRSDQVALGYSKSLAQNKFLITNEAYYKWMKNQIDFRDGAQLFANDNLGAEFLIGRGRSYGNEVYFEKKEGKTTGWIGYTLSWTYRKFSEINRGEWFPTRFDRRNDFTTVVMHRLNNRIQLSSNWIYGTGNAFTVPVARFTLQGPSGESESVVPVYSDRNSFRQAPYHRLDFGLVYKLKPKRGESDITLSIYNAYNRRNPYFVYFDQVRDDNDEFTIGYQAKQVTLFPIIPALTYNFKF